MLLKGRRLILDGSGGSGRDSDGVGNARLHRDAAALDATRRELGTTAIAMAMVAAVMVVSRLINELMESWGWH